MLLRFAIQNFKSFRDEAVLSFVATARRDQPALRFPSKHAKHGVLPAIGVWGANASGKTNLLDALVHVRRLVRDSFIRHAPDTPVPWPRWEPRSEDEPAPRAEMDILMEEGVRIHFGFELGSGGFEKEWLYRYDGSRRKVLYYRDAGEPEPWYFGPALKGRKAQVAESTRANSLFISAAAQHNLQSLLPIYHGLVQGISPSRPIGLSGFPIFERSAPVLQESFKPVLQQLLGAADLGVSGFEVAALDDVEETNLEEMEKIFQPKFLRGLRKGLKKSQEGKEPCFLRLKHARQGGLSWPAPPESESRGTMVFLARITDLFYALSTGALLVLDEIDASLHPDLCRALVQLFTSTESNPHGAQLLFSTHSRDLLDTLRTDEVVLVSKDRAGMSSIEAASDYQRTRDSLRLAHERGQLGAVPLVRDFASILSKARD